MSWKAFLVAWATGTLGVTIGRWFWAWWVRRKAARAKKTAPGDKSMPS